MYDRRRDGVEKDVGGGWDGQVIGHGQEVGRETREVVRCCITMLSMNVFLQMLGDDARV